MVERDISRIMDSLESVRDRLISTSRDVSKLLRERGFHDAPDVVGGVHSFSQKRYAAELLRLCREYDRDNVCAANRRLKCPFGVETVPMPVTEPPSDTASEEASPTP